MTATGINLFGVTGTANIQSGFYILYVSTGNTAAATVTVSYFNQLSKSCHFNPTWEDDFGVFPGCLDSTTAAPTFTSSAPAVPSLTSWTFSNDLASVANPYYQPRYDLGSLSVGNYILFKLLGSASSPYLDTLSIILYSGLNDTVGTDLSNKCDTPVSCTFSFIITEAAQTYLVIKLNSYSVLGQILETLHITVDAFENLANFNAGTPSISGFPIQKTDAHRDLTSKVIQITQGTSFEVKMTNVPSSASDPNAKQAGWALKIVSTSTTLGSLMNFNSSDLLTVGS